MVMKTVSNYLSKINKYTHNLLCCMIGMGESSAIYSFLKKMPHLPILCHFYFSGNIQIAEFKMGHDKTDAALELRFKNVQSR